MLYHFTCYNSIITRSLKALSMLKKIDLVTILSLTSNLHLLRLVEIDTFQRLTSSLPLLQCNTDRKASPAGLGPKKDALLPLQCSHCRHPNQQHCKRIHLYSTPTFSTKCTWHQFWPMVHSKGLHRTW